MKYKKNVRDIRKKIDDDEGIIINLRLIPPEVRAIFFLIRLRNL